MNALINFDFNIFEMSLSIFSKFHYQYLIMLFRDIYKGSQLSLTIFGRPDHTKLEPTIRYPTDPLEERKYLSLLICLLAIFKW